MARWILAGCLSTLVACGGGDGTGSTAPTTDPEGGACGDVTTHDLTVRAKVVDTDGQAVSGAEVRLVEEGWNPVLEVYGTATTGADGVGEFLAPGVVAVEDCWGVVLNYRIDAQLGDRTGSKDYNSALFNAVTAGDDTVDTTNFPVTIE